MNSFNFFIISLLLVSCSVQKKLTISSSPIADSARTIVLANKTLQTAHVGIYIYEPATAKTWYDYQGDHYFVPASNTKIPTCYAAMKYLGDSITQFKVWDTADLIYIQPCGDPTFLHKDFPNQPFFNELKQTNKKLGYAMLNKNDITSWGSGWSWDDYQEAYLAERSEMPIYGNVIRFERVGNSVQAIPPIMKAPYMDEPMIQLMGRGEKFTVIRNQDENKFRFTESSTVFKGREIPFKNSNNGYTALTFLCDTLKRDMRDIIWGTNKSVPPTRVIHSVATDSLLKPMMHHSDNFFAEQCLLMASNQLLGYMDDGKIIDTILKTDFKDLPQKPRWADGSGLSRYNLFSPRDFVAILGKMKDEFGMERIKDVFETGGEGTISSYYKTEAGFIYAKTGTLSGVVAFSGFLYTKQDKLLIFSTLVNNHTGSATEVRRAVEKFLQWVRNEN